VQPRKARSDREHAGTTRPGENGVTVHNENTEAAVKENRVMLRTFPKGEGHLEG
jgi:hypothetical protein